MLDGKALKAEAARCGLSLSALAKIIGMSPDTFYRKVKTDGFYTKEAELIALALGCRDLTHVFFADKVS